MPDQANSQNQSPRRRYHQAPLFRYVRASHSLHWLKTGWHFFITHPTAWFFIAASAFSVLFVSSLLFVPIPVIGPMVPPVLLALLIGGLVFAAKQQYLGKKPRVKDLFEGFRLHSANLSLVGVFYSIPLVFMHQLTMLALGGGLLVGVLGHSLGSSINNIASGVNSLFVVLVLGWGLFFLFYGAMLLSLVFAPALIMFRGVAPLKAMQISLKASMKNLSSMLLFALELSVVFVTMLFAMTEIAKIRWGYGVPVLISLMMALTYISVVAGALHAAYLDIFEPTGTLEAPGER